jgi:Kef-type K+ transport system membrane component KefB
MKSIIVGVVIYILGFILVALCSSIFDSGNVEFSYYYGIIFSILYLSAIVGISTKLILKELRKSPEETN